MIKDIEIGKISDFPIIGAFYKKNFKDIDSHLVIDARIINKYLINELADSINREGLHHPVIVRPYGKDYQMISGHLRKYAFKKLSKKKIPARTLKLDNIDANAMLITSNRLQRPLDAIEESWVVRNLVDNPIFCDRIQDLGKKLIISHT